MRNLTIGFIGLGLIGGSIAKAIRRVYPQHHIIAYNRSEAARRNALTDGTADTVTDRLDNHFSDCDYIFLCTPVEHNISYLQDLKTLIGDNCIITDVGSVKENIHAAVEKLSLNPHFIGGHPMAGSEKTGYENADSYLLENAYYAITPTAEVSRERVEEFFTLITGIGAIPVMLDYREHDYAVAAISHVPHLIAAALVNLVKENDSPQEFMKLLAAGGFKDITRIASSSPDMWQQICSTNRDNITTLLDKYIFSLQKIRSDIANEVSHAVYDLFTESRDYRDSFSNQPRGLMTKTFVLYCDIIDESGAISTIASILAAEKISIKNIGIVNNRETEAGVLKIEFYDQQAVDFAHQLLTSCGYTLYTNQ